WGYGCLSRHVISSSGGPDRHAVRPIGLPAAVECKPCAVVVNSDDSTGYLPTCPHAATCPLHSLRPACPARRVRPIADSGLPPIADVQARCMIGLGLRQPATAVLLEWDVRCVRASVQARRTGDDRRQCRLPGTAAGIAVARGVSVRGDG